MTTTTIKANIQQLNREEQAEIARFIIDLMAETNTEVRDSENSKNKEYQAMKNGLIEAFEEIEILKKNKNQRVTLNDFLNES